MSLTYYQRSSIHNLLNIVEILPTTSRKIIYADKCWSYDDLDRNEIKRLRASDDIISVKLN